MLLLGYTTANAQFHLRKDNYRVLTNLQCKDGSNPCQCPAACFTSDNTTRTCTLKKCYSYDENLGQCKASGKDATTALLLQIFLGYLGVGFGYLENWFLFGIFWGVIGGFIFLLCAAGCCCCRNPEDREATVRSLASCFSCLITVFVIVMYIYGIVIIAQKETGITGDGCPLV